MTFSDRFIDIAKKVLPMPFTIAVLLTLVTILLVFVVDPKPPSAKPSYEISVGGNTVQVTPERYAELQQELNIPNPSASKKQEQPRALQIMSFWEKGFWELLEFAMQMVLILVLGHALALTSTARRIIDKIVSYCTNTANTAALVAFSAIFIGLLNWGLGLIFGAILARKAGESAVLKNKPLNYPLIGAAGYAGLMVWHGGLSGSAPLKVTEPGHFLQSIVGIIPPEETLFSLMNITASILLLALVPLVLFFIGRKSKGNIPNLSLIKEKKEINRPIGAEKLDYSKALGYSFGAVIIALGIYKGLTYSGSTPFSFLTLNYVNFMLFGFGILLHGSFIKFIRAIDEAVGGAAGIIIQFPIYAGIMGIMKYSGLINSFADFFIQISNAETLPIFTFISAAIVNIFVPSGGGQWAVQGPIVAQSALDIGSSFSKNVMALAYGDQLTNMIQPFWALPLLGITGLDAKDILPYTLIIMLTGIVIFLSCLLLF